MSQVKFKFHGVALFFVGKDEEGGVQAAERETEAEVRVPILKADWLQSYSVALCKTLSLFLFYSAG